MASPEIPTAIYTNNDTRIIVDNRKDLREQYQVSEGEPYGSSIIDQTTLLHFYHGDGNIYTLQYDGLDEIVAANHAIKTATYKETDSVENILLSKEQMKYFLDQIMCIRHASTIFNEEEKIQGRFTDPPLSEKGEQEAQQLGETISDRQNIALFFSSELKRSLQTGNNVIEVSSIDTINVLPQLGELDFGIWEKEKYEKLVKEDPKWNIWVKNPISASLEGIPKNGEPLVNFLKRVNAAIQHIYTGLVYLDQEQIIGIVSHRVVFEAIRFLSILSKNDVADLNDVERLKQYEKLFFYQDYNQQKGNSIPNARPFLIDSESSEFV